MRHKVTGKQPNSKMCLVCGLKNQFGLRSFFYELDNGELLAIFQAMEEHQGYPGRMHGGIATAILDESIGRVINVKHNDMVWGVTVEFNIKFKKPIPLNEDVRVICRLTEDSERVFEGTGEILLADGKVAAEGWGKYVKLPLDRIADFDAVEQEWRVVESEKDPVEVEL